MTVRSCGILSIIASIAAASGLAQPAVEAAVIAHDDFESYTEAATIIGGNGGSGWSSAWVGNTPANLPTTLTTSGNILGFGRSLELGTPGGDHRNIVQREFAPQTGAFYIGFVFQTGDWDGDFFQMYVNADNTLAASTTTSSVNSSFTVGILNDPGMNRYFARKGSATAGVGATSTATLQHTANAIHTLIMKFSKSTGVATDAYDEVAMWVDQASEGTPTAVVSAAELGFSSGTTPALGDTISVLHVRMNVESTDRAYLDNLTVATTYAEAVPEPSSIIMAGFLGAALIGAGRRWSGQRSRPELS